MTIQKNNLIEFTNLNMDTPLDTFNQEGTDRIFRLLYFIDIGEADLH